jgi:hypothetical protein
MIVLKRRLAFLLLALAGCASGDDVESTTADLNAGHERSERAACAGDQDCLRAYALRTLFASRLMITESGRLCSEVVSTWFGAPEGTIPSLKVTTTDHGRDLRVDVELLTFWRELVIMNMKPARCRFAFTIRNDRIVERDVTGDTCEGASPPQ